jgi:hypothetical protein
VGEYATEQTVSQVATELLDFLKTLLFPAASEDGNTCYDSITLFAYDFGGPIVKEVG